MTEEFNLSEKICEKGYRNLNKEVLKVEDVKEAVKKLKERIKKLVEKKKEQKIELPTFISSEWVKLTIDEIFGEVLSK